MDESDFNVFLEKFPNPILFSIDKKLDKIQKPRNKISIEDKPNLLFQNLLLILKSLLFI